MQNHENKKKKTEIKANPANDTTLERRDAIGAIK